MEVKLRKNGSHPPGYWTSDRLKEAASHFTTIKDFKKNEGSAYRAACTMGIVSQLNLKSAKNFLTEEYIIELSQKYKYLKDFARENPSAYVTVRKLGIRNKLTFSPLGDYKDRAIYAFIWPETSTIYIGLTGDLGKRRTSHLSSNRSAVSRYILQSGIEPKFIILDGYMPVDQAKFKENEFVHLFKNSGFNVINVAKPGGIGSGKRGIWTFERVKAEAEKYEIKRDFKKGNKLAHDAATRHKWMRHFTHFKEIVKPVGYWNAERIIPLATQFDTCKELIKEYPGAYNAAQRLGILDQLLFKRKRIKL